MSVFLKGRSSWEVSIMERIVSCEDASMAKEASLEKSQEMEDSRKDETCGREGVLWRAALGGR